MERDNYDALVIYALLGRFSSIYRLNTIDYKELAPDIKISVTNALIEIFEFKVSELLKDEAAQRKRAADSSAAPDIKRRLSVRPSEPHIT